MADDMRKDMRKRTEDPRNSWVQVRVTAKHRKRLEALVKKLRCPAAEIVEMGIDSVFECNLLESDAVDAVSGYSAAGGYNVVGSYVPGNEFIGSRAPKDEVKA